ncbi:hypothetical protein FSP39_002949 [Pinctada imbricata]|uniref:C2H2-type domain-containing protein n=1 Tax=Pinctada imbricata TaxID=66713 RepID=A0AA88XY38_PINIB|nr:hypothetical protein FSP39_002949 [Pinctada imbricata]
MVNQLYILQEHIEIGVGFKVEDVEVKNVIESHHPCQLCDKYYKSRKALQLHVRLKHDVTPYLACDFCPMKFKRNGDLKRHVLTHAEIEMFTCALCGKNFKHRASLKVHEDSHAGKTFTCENPGCEKVFKFKSNMKRHQNSCGKKYQCQYCSLLFTYLWSHEKICPMNQSEKEVFTCDMCGADFKVKRYMTEHIKYSHTNTDRYKCQTCPMTFSHRKAFIKHRENCH